MVVSGWSSTLIKSLGVKKVFKNVMALSNGISWSKDGNLCLISSADDSVHVYSTTTNNVRSLYSRKHGCSQVSINPGSKTCSIASNEDKSVERSIRIWDINENKFTRSFSIPHQFASGPFLQVSEKGDLFAVACKNKSIHIFTNNGDSSPTCILSATSDATPCCSWDNRNLIFAASLSAKLIQLYDQNNILEGEFCTINLSQKLKLGDTIVALTFSTCDRY
eukprot:GHVP01025535.1.p1 GENE.GHVP01025535.1~~GHVP01025535.1.p1  ORF type:complete len:221 (+),score=21.55 GHVP01025535.1:101-763(+)